MWSRISLRNRLTILTAIIITTVCICLTILSIHSAGRLLTASMETEGIQHIEEGGRKVGFSMVMNESKQQFNQSSIVYMLIFIGLGTGLTYLISGRVLKPIQKLNQSIEEIDENNLNARIKVESNGFEVVSLGESFNHMLARLEGAFESQKRFAHHAAHELKTPLASIMTNIEVLEMDEHPSQDEYKEVIEVVKESTERLTQLVTELLNLNVSLREERIMSISAHEMIEQIIHELESSIKEKKIRISNDCHCTLYGDPDLLYHVFFNLIQNAVKYNKSGGKVSVLSHGNQIIIEDTGVGIPSDSLKNIFEPFYCVDPSRAKHLGGHGLGLSVVKSIIDKHKGTIQVESEVGVGTKIMVEI